MAIRGFTTVPKDTREWGKFFRETTVTADVVSPNTVDTAMLVDNAVTDAKLRNSSPLSVIGRPVNSSGDPSDIAAANDGEVLRRSGTSLGFGSILAAAVSDFTEAAQDAVGAALANTSTVNLSYVDATPAITASIVTDSVSNTLLANMTDSTIKGRASGAGTGDPTDLTAAQVAAIVATAVASALNLTSGTYTQTLTGVTNIDSVTDLGGRYIRLGNIVFVSGAALIDATTNGLATEVGISLPVASTLGSDFVVAGSASANAITQTGAILGDNANDRARLQFIAASAAAQVMWWTFAYLIV